MWNISKIYHLIVKNILVLKSLRVDSKEILREEVI